MSRDIKKIKRKIELASELFGFAFEIKKHQIKKKHPDLSDKDLQSKTIALFHGESHL